MTKREQVKFVKELMGNLQSDILRKIAEDKVPCRSKWELRHLIADHAEHAAFRLGEPIHGHTTGFVSSTTLFKEKDMLTPEAFKELLNDEVMKFFRNHHGSLVLGEQQTLALFIVEHEQVLYERIAAARLHLPQEWTGEDIMRQEG